MAWRTSLQWALWIIGLGLQFLVASALLGGRVRKHIAILIYTAILFLTTVSEMIYALDAGGSTLTHQWSVVFWAGEVFRLAALYGVVLSSIARAIPETRRRSTAARLLPLAAGTIWALTFYTQWNANPDLWMTNADRNLSFFAAVVNLGLWLILIAMRKRDSQILLITGGLGIQMTGAAIGQSLRQMSRMTVLMGGLIAVLSHFVCLYIWYQALRSERRTASPDSRRTSTPHVPHGTEPSDVASAFSLPEASSLVN